MISFHAIGTRKPSRIPWTPSSNNCVIWDYRLFLAGRSFDGDRLAEPEPGTASSADRRRVLVQDILFEFVQRLGHPFEAGFFGHIVARITVHLHAQKQIVQVFP